MTTREQALTRLIEVVADGKRHPYYDRTRQLAGLYRKLVTGDGLDELLRQFTMRESAQAFKQRVDITQHVVTSVVANIMDVFYKIPRSNYNRVCEYDKEHKAKQEPLNEIMKAFWGTKTLDEWFKTRWFEMIQTDPNAFVVTEFAPFDPARGERAMSYPFEVDSESAVDYQYDNNVLQHLIVRSTFPMPKGKKSDGVGEKYTLYLANETMTLTEVETSPLLPSPPQERQFYEVDGGALIRFQKRVFFLLINQPHNAGTVPAFQVGYARDQWTGGATFVAPFEKCVPMLLKTIKSNSELDLTMALSAFPFRAEYAPACTAEGCIDGHLSNGDTCHSCKGTGHQSVTSAQEKLVLTLPKRGDELLDLEKLVVFKSPSVDIMKFQQDYIDALTRRAKSIVFNSDIFSRSEIADTATGKNIDLTNVYDTLFPCAQGYAEKWRFQVYAVARFADLQKGLTAMLVFSKDFKLKDLAALLSELESANRSDAGPVVIRNIQADIARIVYADNPKEYHAWEVREMFNPFSGQTSDKITIALSSASVPNRLKVQYLLLGTIFDDLEFEAAQDGQSFYLLPSDVQRTKVVEKVQSYIAEAQGATRPVLAVNPN